MTIALMLLSVLLFHMMFDGVVGWEGPSGAQSNGALACIGEEPAGLVRTAPSWVQIETLDGTPAGKDNDEKFDDLLNSIKEKNEPEALGTLLDSLGESKQKVLKMKTKRGNTVLHYAARWNSKALKTLLAALGNAKAEVLEMPNEEGVTALHLAAQYAPDALEQLLDSLGESKQRVLKMTDDWGMTVLDRAVIHNPKVGVIVKLVEALGDAAKDALTDAKGKTLRHLMDQPVLLKALAKSSIVGPLFVEAATMVIDDDGRTMWHNAVLEMESDVVEQILGSLKTPEAMRAAMKPDKAGWTAWHYAVWQGRTDIEKQLTEFLGDEDKKKFRDEVEMWRTENKDKECSICYNHRPTAGRFSKTQCGHAFHETCLGFWLQRVKTCPLCRAIISNIS